jgi:hypothetical protein
MIEPTITRNREKTLIEFKYADFTLPITMENQLPEHIERHMIQVKYARKDGRNVWKKELDPKYLIFLGRDGPCLDIAQGPDGRVFFRLYKNEQDYKNYGGPHFWVGSAWVAGNHVSIWEGGLNDDFRTVYERI